MELNASIETRESTREKARAALGLDLSSALDLVSRSDYDSEEAYLDAATKAELERSNPEYRSIRSRLKAELRQRTEQEERKAQGEAYKAIRANVSLDSVDQKNIDTEAADLARRDLAAGRISASALGATIEQYARDPRLIAQIEGNGGKPIAQYRDGSREYRIPVELVQITK